MKHRIIIKEKNGLAGVIEALLLVGLVAIILSTIQLIYVPQIMEEKEADHMDQVENQFSQLKSVVEIQSMMGVMGSGEPIAYSPISSSLTLGSGQLPYFVTAAAHGQIQIIDEDSTESSEIEMDPADLPNEFINGIPLTSIKYEAQNYYFVRQTYILEGGGIILEQPESETMKVSPAIKIENHSGDGYIKIYYVIPLFTSKPGKNIDSGLKNCFIRTNYITHYSSIETQSDELDNDHLYIYTDHIKAWNESLIKDDTGLLWEYYDNGYINVDFNDPISPECIQITSGTKNIDFEITIVEIEVQIGPGVVQ
jgi:hypothetical protein